MSSRTEPSRSSVLSIDADQYHADELGADRPSLSASLAHLLVTSSPRHAWTQHPRLNPDFKREHDDKFDVGTAAHWLLLQGDTADIVTIIEANDWKTNAAKEQRDAARAVGRLPLLAKHWDGVQAMVASVREKIAAADCTPPLFADGASEQTLVWEDDHGVLCRARLDWLRSDLATIDDLKTTKASAKPQAWARRTMFAIGADVQMAFYLRGVAKLHPELRGQTVFRYVVVEAYPPYEISIIEPDAAILEVGRLKVEEALAKWALCLEEDFWPGYPTQPYRAELPAWVEAEWLDGREEAA